MARQDWSALLESIRTDHRSGATALTRRAAEGLATLSEGAGATPASEEELRARLRALASVRPPFGSLFRLANGAAEACSGPRDSADRAGALGQLGARLTADLASQHAAVVDSAADLVARADSVLTISASSLVRDTLLAGVGARGSGPLVTCLESRPGLEGELLARELAAAGLRVRLAPDAAAGRLAGEADLVLLGGDTLSPAGLIHKLGTLGLALAARERDVAVYTLLGSLKVLPAPVRGWQEDGAPAETATPLRPHHPAVWSRLFDLTTLGLLRGVVTELGILAPEEAAGLGSVEAVHPWLADLLER